MQRAALQMTTGRIPNGTPKGSRTPNLQIRSLALYPVELWVQRGTVKERSLKEQGKRLFAKMLKIEGE